MSTWNQNKRASYRKFFTGSSQLPLLVMTGFKLLRVLSFYYWPSYMHVATHSILSSALEDHDYSHRNGAYEEKLYWDPYDPYIHSRAAHAHQDCHADTNNSSYSVQVARMLKCTLRIIPRLCRSCMLATKVLSFHRISHSSPLAKWS